MQQGWKSRFIFFNILISDLFLDDIEIDLAICANNTTPYAYDYENEKGIIVTYLEAFLLVLG